MKMEINQKIHLSNDHEFIFGQFEIGQLVRLEGDIVFGFSFVCEGYLVDNHSHYIKILFDTAHGKKSNLVFKTKVRTITLLEDDPITKKRIQNSFRLPNLFR